MLEDEIKNVAKSEITDEKIKKADRYIIVYNGNAENFKEKYLDTLLKNRFTPYKYFNYTQKTIVFIEDSGEASDLEERLNVLHDQEFSIELDAVYRTMNE